MIAYVHLLLACFLVLDSNSWAQNSTATDAKPPIIEEVNRLANAQKNLTLNNTPGADLWAREISRTKSPEGTLVQYEFFGRNLPANLEYRFGILRINQELQMDSKLKTLDVIGKLVDGPDDPLELFVMAAKGEPYRFQVASTDGQYRAFLSVVPFPIIGSDKNCSIEAILLTPDAEAVLLQGKGFPRNSEVHVDSDSEGEKHGGKVKTDNDGKYSFVIMPYKAGTQKGVANVKVTSADCHPTLQFTWGKGTYHVE